MFKLTKFSVIGRGMDFPDVSLVLQVGLPLDADSYTHRVGRTARAGKDGRAIILLTQAESFFLKVNRQFPIQPYPACDKVLNDSSSSKTISSALRSIDPQDKQKAYSAYLGFMKGSLHKMKMTADDLVKMANRLALEGMECDELPEMQKKTIGKMGLKGVHGIRYAAPSSDSRSNIGGAEKGVSNPNHAIEDSEPSRRLRHQGPPDPLSTSGNQRQRDSHNQRDQGTRGGKRPSKREFIHPRTGQKTHPGNIAKQKRRDEKAMRDASNINI